MVDFDSKWRIVDSDQDGKIVKSDISAAVGLIPGLTESKVQEVWDELNTTPDGTIWYHEACLAMINWFACSGNSEEEIIAYVTWKDETKQVVQEADLDGDGTIDIKELKLALDYPIQDDIQKLLNYFDKNNDDKISIEELLPRLFRFEQRKKRAVEIWSRADPNWKYVVYQSELQQYADEVDWLPDDFWQDIDAN